MKKELHPYSLLLTEEERIIMKTRKLREDMVDNFINENRGLPSKTGEIRVINEVLNSLDDQVLGLVDKRLKHDENKTNGDIKENLVAIFKELDKNKGKPREEQDVNLSDKYIPVDIVPGEDQIDFETIELKEIMQ